MAASDEGPSIRRRRLFALADTFGLTRDERIELSEMLLRADVESWKNLTDAQVSRLIDALEGTALVTYMMNERPREIRR